MVYINYLSSVIGIFLVIAIVFTSIPVIGGSGLASAADSSSKKAIKSGAFLAFLTGIVYYIVNKINDDNLEEYYQAGKNYTKKETWDKAIESYQKVYDISSKYKDIAKKLPETKKKAANSYIENGDRALNYKKYERAMNYYEMALSYQPFSQKAKNKINNLKKDIVFIHYRKGRSYERQDDWKNAYYAYEKAYNYNHDYKDLKEHYFRSRAKFKEGKSLSAILFFVNHTDQNGLEKKLIENLQFKLAESDSTDYYPIKQERVKDILDKKMDRANTGFDKKLALDTGRILRIDKSIFGEIRSITKKDDRIEIETNVKIVNLQKGNISAVYNINYLFPEEVDLNNLGEHINQLAKKIVERLD